MRQGKRLGGAAEELLELEVEAEVAVVDRQPADGRPGQRPGRPGQAAEDAGRALGGEGRIAGQQLVGAVAAQHDRDLAPRETAQEVRRQDRGVAERLVEPGRDLGQELVDRRRPRRSARDGRSPGGGRPRGRAGSRRSSGSSKPIENVCTFRGRLDLAERRGDARGIDAAREEDAERHVRPPVPRDRVAELVPEPLGRRPRSRRPLESRRRTAIASTGSAGRRPFPRPGRGCAAASAATRQIECGAGTYS